MVLRGTTLLENLQMTILQELRTSMNHPKSVAKILPVLKLFLFFY